jgi:hypothetical protein
MFFVDRHICAPFLCGFNKKRLLQAFSSHCLFCSDKELRKLPGKTDEKRMGKKMRTLQDSADQRSGEHGFPIIHGNNQPGGQSSACNTL